MGYRMVYELLHFDGKIFCQFFTQDGFKTKKTQKKIICVAIIIHTTLKSIKSKNHIWNGILGVDNYSVRHSTHVHALIYLNLLKKFFFYE